MQNTPNHAFTSGITPPDVKSKCVNWWLEARENILERVFDPRPVVPPNPNPTNIVKCVSIFVAKNRICRKYKYFLVLFLLRFDSDKWDLTQTLLRYRSQKVTVKAPEWVYRTPWNIRYTPFWAQNVSYPYKTRYTDTADSHAWIYFLVCQMYLIKCQIF